MSRCLCSYNLGWGDPRCCLHASWCLAAFIPGALGIPMFILGRKSLIGLWKMDIAGYILVAAYGVFLYCNLAWMNPGLSRLPWGPVMSIKRLFIDFTANSAMPLIFACATDDILQ